MGTLEGVNPSVSPRGASDSRPSLPLPTLTLPYPALRSFTHRYNSIGFWLWGASGPLKYVQIYSNPLKPARIHSIYSTPLESTQIYSNPLESTQKGGRWQRRRLLNLCIMFLFCCLLFYCYLCVIAFVSLFFYILCVFVHLLLFLFLAFYDYLF